MVANPCAANHMAVSVGIGCLTHVFSQVQMGRAAGMSMIKCICMMLPLLVGGTLGEDQGKCLALNLSSYPHHTVVKV